MLLKQRISCPLVLTPGPLPPQWIGNLDQEKTDTAQNYLTKKLLFGPEMEQNMT